MKHSLLMANLKYLILLITYLFTTSVTVANSRSLIENTTDSTTFDNTISLKDSIVNFGKMFIGTPYRYGATGTSTFDCSGFTSYVYNNFGIKIPRTSAEQARQYETIKKQELQVGDLVFFQGRRINGRVGHVGIVVEKNDDNNEFSFLHASVGEGVTITNSTSKYFQQRYVKAVRIFDLDTLLSIDKINTIQEETLNNELVEKVEKIIPAKYHYVKKGENLSIIAKKNGLTVTQLKKQNSLKNNLIKIKQKLLITKEEIILVAQPLATKKNLEKLNEKADTSLNIKKNIYRKHIVENKETLFSIAKKYKINIDTLKAINKLTNNNIKLGQTIFLSQTTKIKPEALAKKDSVVEKEIIKIASIQKQQPIEKNTYYKVQKGESLYSISKKFNLSVNDLKSMNKLTKNTLVIGQSLLVIETKSSIKKI